MESVAVWLAECPGAALLGNGAGPGTRSPWQTQTQPNRKHQDPAASTRSRRRIRDALPPPLGETRSSPEERPSLTPDFFGRDRLDLASINLPRAPLRFDEP